MSESRPTTGTPSSTPVPMSTPSTPSTPTVSSTTAPSTSDSVTPHSASPTTPLTTPLAPPTAATPPPTTVPPLASTSVHDGYNNFNHQEDIESQQDDLPSPMKQVANLGAFFQDFRHEFKSLAFEMMQYSKHQSWKKKLLTAFLCVASILVFYDLIFDDTIVRNLGHFIHWMARHSTYAVFAFIGIFVLSTLIFVPPTILIFGAGYAFTQAIGLAWGITSAIFSCFLGSCIGAVIAFLRSRYMMRDMIHLFSKRYPLVRAADRALKRNGLRIMLLLRLCPLIPFNGLNYCCGVTGVSLHHFTLSLVGILPFQIFTVVVGATAGTLAPTGRHKGYYSESQELGWIILICSGVAFGIVALVYTWKVVKKELRKELELSPEQFENYLRPEEIVQEQGGIEPSIEANYNTSHKASDDGEEWFWVWA